MLELKSVLPAHLVGGTSLHVADVVLYGLAAIGLAAGVAPFASGRAGRAEGHHTGDEPPSMFDRLPSSALVKARPGEGHRRDRR